MTGIGTPASHKGMPLPRPASPVPSNGEGRDRRGLRGAAPGAASRSAPVGGGHGPQPECCSHSLLVAAPFGLSEKASRLPLKLSGVSFHMQVQKAWTLV